MRGPSNFDELTMNSVLQNLSKEGMDQRFEKEFL